MIRALFILLLPCAVLADLPAPGTPGAPADPRYCGEPERYADGTIKRSQRAVEEFKRIWPMPQDGRVWYVDHVLPISVGGCPGKQENLQWLPADLKTCRFICKDRWERRVYNVAPIPSQSIYPKGTP